MREKQVRFPGLVAMMASRGDTQETLANVMHMSKSAISRRLTGEVEWSLGEVKAICNYYNTGYYELFEARR